MTKFNLVFASFLITIIATAQTKSVNVYFDFDKYNVKQKESIKLDKAKTELSEIVIDSIVCSGHTDSKGSVEYNYRLSKNRVNSVIKKLTPHYSCPINSSFHSELKPVSSNDNADGSDNPSGRQNNRRVEVMYYYHLRNNDVTEIQAESTQSSAGKTSLIDSAINEIYNAPVGGYEIEWWTMTEEQQDSLKQESEACYDSILTSLAPDTIKKIFGPKENQVILTESGSAVIIHKKTFVNKNGKKPEEIHFEMKECYSLSSMISSNLTTRTSNGEILETAGMMELSATDENGDELQMKRSITIGMPVTNNTRKDSMQLYESTTDSNGNVVWTLAEKPGYQKPFKLDWKKSLFEIAREMAGDDTKKNIGIDVIEGGLNLYQKQKSGEEFEGKDLKLFTQTLDNEREKKEAQQQAEKENRDQQLHTNERYLMNTTKMGTVNCDRSAISSINGKRIRATSQEILEPVASGKIMMIFKRVNSQCPSDNMDHTSAKYFNKVPNGAEIILLGMKVIGDDLYLGIRKMNINSKLEKLTFKKVSQDEFKTKVDGLMQL